jgi:hypothetical protein
MLDVIIVVVAILPLLIMCAKGKKKSKKKICASPFFGDADSILTSSVRKDAEVKGTLILQKQVD